MRINATDTEYDAATAHLDDCVSLAGDWPRHLHEHRQQLATPDRNQAFSERIHVSEIDTIEPELGTPFDVLFNPAVQAEAVHRYQAATHDGRSPLDTPARQMSRVTFILHPASLGPPDGVW